MPGYFTDWVALPNSFMRSDGGVALDATLGHPAPSLRSDGGGRWWFIPNWTVTGNFVASFDLFIGTGGRDIANFAFWVTNPGAAPTGFMFRLQTAAGDGGVYAVSNGSHATTSSPRVPEVMADVWYAVTLTMSGTVLTWDVRRKDNSATHATGSENLAAYVGQSRPAAGCFGQKADGAGTANGHRWDNLRIAYGAERWEAF